MAARRWPKRCAGSRGFHRRGNKVTKADALSFFKDDVPILAVLVGLNRGKRLFMIGGHGKGGVVNAVNHKGHIEAKLTVVLMPSKPVKVALRQIQAGKDGKGFAL